MEINVKNKFMDKFRSWYGNWSARFAEGFFLYGAFSSALTSLWIIQNILKESFQIKVSLIWIGVGFTILFCIGVYAVDKLGLIEARNNAMSQRNKYFRKIK